MRKRVCFVGHRFQWHCINVEQKLKEIIHNVILQGYSIFYDGGYGYFDELSTKIILDIKVNNPNIKLIKVLTNYSQSKKYPDYYDETILPELEEYFYKQRIIKRNQWIVDNSDIVICHVIHEFNSGAYKTLQYAIKKHKKIIYV